MEGYYPVKEKKFIKQFIFQGYLDEGTCKIDFCGFSFCSVCV